jgi:hypothetical protein
MKPTPRIVFAAALLATGAIAPLAAQTSSPSEWRTAQKRDAADSYDFTRFTLTGRFANAQQGGDRPAITVDCIAPQGAKHGKFLVAALQVGKPVQIKYVEPEDIRGTSYYPKLAVSYRTDSTAEARTENWPLGTDRTPAANPADKTAASIPSGTFKRILHAHSVAITVSDAQGAPLEMHFDMPSALPVEAGCDMGE